MKKIILCFSILLGAHIISNNAFSQKVYVISSTTEDNSIPAVNKLKVYVTSDTLLFDVSVFLVATAGEMASNKTEYSQDAIWAPMPNESSSCLSIKYVNTREEADLVVRIAPDANSAWWANEEKKAFFASKKKSNCN
jgi:hypothetical protein